MDQTSDAQPHLSHLSELARDLRLHQHLCVIYRTEEERLAAALPYLKAGLERRERCLYVADEKAASPVFNALRKGGIDVDHCLESRALVVIDKPHTHLGHERFDPDRWIGFLSQTAREAGAEKFSGLTILGEMTWALGEDTTPERLVEYEARFNQLTRENDVRGLCQYNRDRFPPEIMLRVLRTHPVVVYGGIVCNNPYYVPPEEFLAPDQASREVERLLNNIVSGEQSLVQLRALAARLQTVREDERSRTAREIHDELGQALTAIKLEFATLLRDLPAPQDSAKQRGRSILNLLDQAIQSVRRIATGLRPTILDDLGLVAALEWAADDFQTRTGTRCQISLPDVDVGPDPERATALFRIFQETLTNIARHANATHVSIRLTEENGSVILEVHDNGIGIGEAQLSSRASLGILGMRERVLLLGGTLTIIGTPGKGTLVRVLIPDSRQVVEQEKT
jgi:signal transduction histidine kinase